MCKQTMERTMNIKKIILENFRGFSKRTEIILENDITAFIGKNDAGKSTIMEALDIFFNGVPDAGDVSVGSKDGIVRIACSFSEFPRELVIDSSRKTSFEAEHLLDTDGLLTIEQEFNCAGAKPKLTAVCAIANHPSDNGVSDLLELKIEALKKRAKDLGVNLENTNQSVSSELRRAIWKSRPLTYSERKISLHKEDGKKIFDAITNYFPMVYLFKSDRPSTDQDEEAQDPMSVAIHNIVEQKANEFQQITESVKVALSTIAEETVAAIATLSPGLAKVLKPQVTTKKLDSLFSVSLTGDDDIPINKRGSGVRRLILLGFLKAEVERRRRNPENETKGIVYAIEEPETSQHPDNQMMLLDALRELADEEGTQVLITTHTPVLAERLDARSLRFVRKCEESFFAEVVDASSEAVKREIIETLGVLPDNRIRLFIGVEGVHDIQFLCAISKNLARLHPDCYPDLEKEEKKGTVVFIPMGGTNLKLWTYRLNGTNRPQVYFLDRDNEPPEAAKYEQYRLQFEAEGHLVFMTAKKEMENYIPLSLLYRWFPDYGGTGRPFEDVPCLVLQARQSHNGQVMTHMAKRGDAKQLLNTLIAAEITTDALFEEGDPDGEIRGWFAKLNELLADA